MKYFSWLIIAVLFFSCQQEKKKKVKIKPKPTIAIRQELPIELTDSALIRQHLIKYHIDSASIATVIHFYADTTGRHGVNTLAWSKKGKLNGKASMFINLIDHAEDDGLPMKN